MIATFKDLLHFLESVDTDGMYTINNMWQLQIYNNRRQVNICDEDGLSHMNIVYCDKGKDMLVHIYNCQRAGYCDYNHPLEYQIDERVLSIPRFGPMIEALLS